jgi:hypothetical protein
MSTTLENQIDQIIFIGFVLGFRNISSILITRKLVDFIKKNQIENFFLIAVYIFSFDIILLFFSLHKVHLSLHFFYLFSYLHCVLLYDSIEDHSKSTTIGLDADCFGNRLCY